MQPPGVLSTRPQGSRAPQPPGFSERGAWILHDGVLGEPIARLRIPQPRVRSSEQPRPSVAGSLTPCLDAPEPPGPPCALAGLLFLDLSVGQAGFAKYLWIGTRAWRYRGGRGGEPQQPAQGLQVAGEELCWRAPILAWAISRSERPFSSSSSSSPDSLLAGLGWVLFPGI